MKTKDFGLASLCVAKGLDLAGHEVDERGQVWFMFCDSTTTSDIEDRYYKNTIDVRVQDFISAQKMLKTLIFETKRKLEASSRGM